MTTVLLTEHASIEAQGKLNTKKTKPVICIDTGEVFSSCMDAAEYAGVHQSAMSTHCLGKTENCQGKHYCYVKDLPQNLEALTTSLKSKVNTLDKYSDVISEKEMEEKRLLEEQKQAEREAEKARKLQERAAKRNATLKAKYEKKKEKYYAALDKANEAYDEMLKAGEAAGIYDEAKQTHVA